MAKDKQTALTNPQKKEWAKTLYLQGDLTQKEICSKVCVSENTMTAWVNSNEREWDKLRKSLLTSKSTVLRRLYNIMDKTTSEIEASNDTDPKRADQLVKLATAIEKLETETSVAQIGEVARLFINWLQTIDIALALNVAEHFDMFIKKRLKSF